MKRNLLYALLVTSTLLISCGDDEPQIDAIVGKWELDDVVFSNAPAGFSLQNGQSQNVYGESSYEIEFVADNTFERELRFSDGSIFEDEGEWERNQENIDLDLDSQPVGLVESFEIVEVDDRDLVMNGRPSFTVLPDALINDQSWRDTVITNADFSAFIRVYGQVITIDAEYSFDSAN